MTKKKAQPKVLLGEEIRAGESRELNFSFAKLHTHTSVEVPIIIHRSQYEGPTVLFTAGIHGDEVNGIEIVRQLVSKGINKPKIGTIICIPIINVFGFCKNLESFLVGEISIGLFLETKKGLWLLKWLINL